MWKFSSASIPLLGETARPYLQEIYSKDVL